MTTIRHDGNDYRPLTEVQPKIGDKIAVLTGPCDHRTVLTGIVHAEDGHWFLGDELLRWDGAEWGLYPTRIIERATLPDGIYRKPNSSYLWFVKDGKYDSEFDDRAELDCPTPLPTDTSAWTRVGDLPVIEVAE